ncbi:cytochrome P450 [Apiospora arundinis]
MTDNEKSQGTSAAAEGDGGLPQRRSSTRDALDDFIDKLQKPQQEKDVNCTKKTWDYDITDPPILTWTTLPTKAKGVFTAHQAFLDRAYDCMGGFSSDINVNISQVQPTNGEFYQYTLYIYRGSGPSNRVKFGNNPVVSLDELANIMGTR